MFCPRITFELNLRSPKKHANIVWGWEMNENECIKSQITFHALCFPISDT